ncbi:MAG: ABC transporter ATP-binding protein [Chloroflexi bacterium]|nr:ABC transporter ATP-binding protein [Chloroflexota bacterium]
MPRVLAQAIVKQFRGVVALDHVTMEFEHGKLTVLVGPSGCGKTTLLRIVAGLEDPTSGDIFIGERPMNDVPPWHRNTAMVFQNYALYPHMSVFDNIAYPLRAHGTPKKEIKDRVEGTAKALGIAELLRRKPREISGGQMQRVAVGRAIVRQPDVFLMDEPLSCLDAKLRVEMRTELKRLQKSLGVTTIYVTHDQAEAMTMADKLIVMRDGHILQAGPPEDLYQRPNSIFVASFIGSPSMNLIDCLYDPDSTRLVASGFSYAVSGRLKAAASKEVGASMVFGFRPEDVGVSTDYQSNAIRASVYMSEPLGRENLLTLQVGDSMFKVVSPPEIHVNLDQAVWLTCREDRVHLFDHVTERSLTDTDGAQ